MSTRYFIKLDYNGTHYHGWQVQPNGVTVQGEINKALSLILREDINIVGCGRTDAGVHARNFYAHFNATNDQLGGDEKLLFKLNRFLKKDIAIYSITKVKADAHTRFDATARTYKYYISTVKDPFLHPFNWYLSNKLNVNLMNEAALMLKRYKDFTSFSKVDTDTKTNNCEITHAEWIIINNDIVFTITADRFLRNMVRAIVGTLIEVGKEKISVLDFCKIIEAKDRCEAGASVPGSALFLEKVSYPYNI